LSGVALTMTGSHPATITTPADGGYSFTGFQSGDTYAITPTKTGYLFGPNSVSGTITAGNVTINFTGGTSTLTGQVKDQNSVAISGVLMTMTGSRPATTTTAADGSFSFPG